MKSTISMGQPNGWCWSFGFCCFCVLTLWWCEFDSSNRRLSFVLCWIWYCVSAIFKSVEQSHALTWNTLLSHLYQLTSWFQGAQLLALVSLVCQLCGDVKKIPVFNICIWFPGCVNTMHLTVMCLQQYKVQALAQMYQLSTGSRYNSPGKFSLYSFEVVTGLFD